MNNPTDTNQANEGDKAMQHICQQTEEHYYSSESIPGGLIHWIRICMTCGHKDDKDLNEQVKTLIRTEKLKLLSEVREKAFNGGLSFELDDSQIVIEVETDLESIITKLEAEL